MANIRQLTEDNNQVFYPQTHEKAVIDGNGNTLDAKIAGIRSAVDGAVKTTSQTLTEAQKQQARANIGAYQKPSSGIPASDLASGVIPDISGKQDTIQDLSTIRSGATLGSTSVQPVDIENMVEAEPIGSIIPPVNPSEFSTKEEVSQLRQEVTADISQLEAEVTDLDKNDKSVLSGVYGYKDIASLSTGASNTDVYYFAQKPKDGIVTGVRYKAKTGITRFSVVRVSQPGDTFALATVVADFTNDAADDGQIVYKDLHIQLAENEYLGIRDNFYYGPASGETQYTNHSTVQNYAPAYNIISHGVNANADDVLEMEKTLYGDVEITNILEGGNINGSGAVTQDTPSRNLYIVYCKYRKIRVSTGELYGFYALPPRLYSVSIDNARHVETLDDTVISIPDGAYYLAVRSATQPTFHSENDSLVERMDTLETMAKGYDIRLVASDIAMFENIGFCGDSYMAGMIVVSENPTVTAQNTNLCWGKILERTHGVNSFIYALGGVSVVDNKPTNAWYLDDANCLPKLLSESAKNLYVISLGHNDAYISTYTSKTKSEFLTEFDTNFRSIISQIASHAPNAKIILCKQSGPYSRMGWGADINAKIAEIGTALNLPVLDPANDEYLSSSVYENTMVHSHPTFAGYAGIAKAFDRQFGWATVQYFDYFKAYTGLS